MACGCGMDEEPGWGLAGLVRGLAARILARRVSRIPGHVAIIPDGNRRWARRRGLPVWVGHYRGYLVMKRTLNRLWDLGVSHITIYALSRENCLRRPRDELEKLFVILEQAYRELERDPRVEKGEVHVMTVGDFTLVPRRLVEVAEELESATRGAPRRLNICLCYGGRWEIVEAVKRLIAEGVEPSEEALDKLMPLSSPPPDLVIRTGGELRLSNFLLWHIAYSELYFTKRLWPDFDDYELIKALLSFSKRARRFGA